MNHNKLVLFIRKNGSKCTDNFVLTLEKSWFIHTKYVPHLKHQAVLNKYREKIVKIVSQKRFDEKIIVNHLLRLVNSNRNELIDDLENLKKENNYLIKIQMSFKACDLYLCIQVNKTKEEKMKVCARIKENGLLDIIEGKEYTISFIKKEFLSIFLDD